MESRKARRVWPCRNVVYSEPETAKHIAASWDRHADWPATLEPVSKRRLETPSRRPSRHIRATPGVREARASRLSRRVEELRVQKRQISS